MRYKYIFLSMAFMLIASCASKPSVEIGRPKPLTNYSDYLPPEKIGRALVPKLNSDSALEYRFNIDSRNVAAQDFYISLVVGTDLNMIVPDDLKGKISVSLKSVTIEDTLKAVRDVYGYDYIRNAYGYKILPRKLQTKIIKLDYINISRQGSTNVTVNSGRLSDSGTSAGITGLPSNNSPIEGNESGTSGSSVASAELTTRNRSNFWSELEASLAIILGDEPGRRVSIDSQAGIVIIRAMPNEIADVETYLEQAQLSLKRQVVIEARILEVTLNEGFQTGIQWQNFSGDFATSGEETGASLGSLAVQNEVLGGVFSLNFNQTDFSGVVELLQTQGDVQVLSNPKISTVNNQKAVIKVGVDEYFVTDISSQQSSTVAGVTSTPQVTLTPFFSGIALDVTPQIGQDDEITLHVHPSVTEVAENNKVINISGLDYNFPSAVTSIRESDSIVKARDGEVVVIGGLIQNKTNEQKNKIPLLGDIPVLGALFTQRKDVAVKSELVILLQPRIVRSEKWNDEYEKVKERYPEWRDAL